MKKITDKEYIEFLEYKQAKTHGRILTPNALRLICEANNNNPETIGEYMLKTLHALEKTSDADLSINVSPDMFKSLKLANKPYADRIGYNPLG